jgi:hypothetical protein
LRRGIGRTTSADPGTSLRCKISEVTKTGRGTVTTRGDFMCGSYFDMTVEASHPAY